MKLQTILCAVVVTAALTSAAKAADEPIGYNAQLELWIKKAETDKAFAAQVLSMPESWPTSVLLSAGATMGVIEEQAWLDEISGDTDGAGEDDGDE